MRAFQTFLLAILLSNPISAIAQELIYCGERVPDNLNPQSSLDWWTTKAVAGPVFERLVEFDRDTQTVGPMLAERWDVNDDQTRFVFSLRQGVKFQPDQYGNIERFTAKDVVATFTMLMDEQNSERDEIDQLLSGRELHAFQGISGVNAIDNHTVEFRFDAPQPSFLVDLSNSVASIWPRAVLDEIAQGGKVPFPVGTGQYAIVSIDHGVDLRYEANQDHWLGTPAFEGMRFVAMPDVTERAYGIATGKCDVAYVPKGQENVFSQFGGEDVTVLPSQFIASGNELICYEADSSIGDLASLCIPSANAANSSDACPKCPKSGACPQSIIAARAECCPKSGACGQ